MSTTDEMPAVVSERLQEIKDLVCDVLEIEPDDVSPTSLFKEDHGADSLRSIEILALLERTYTITIDQAELPRMINLEGVYTVVAEAAGWTS